MSGLFGKKEAEIDTADQGKDVKIERRGRPKGSGKKDDLLTEEQVEVIFSGIFDGIALFRGKHWKLREDEKQIIPSLTRILNRIVESLPKKVAGHAFNIMDYVIVLGSVGAIIMTRITEERKMKENVIEHRAEPERIQSPMQEPSGATSQPSNVVSLPNKGNENGFSFLAPIDDLAKSINRLS